MRDKRIVVLDHEKPPIALRYDYGMSRISMGGHFTCLGEMLYLAEKYFGVDKLPEPVKTQPNKMRYDIKKRIAVNDYFRAIKTMQVDGLTITQVSKHGKVLY
jgi:hypothetical protein